MFRRWSKPWCGCCHPKRTRNGKRVEAVALEPSVFRNRRREIHAGEKNSQRNWNETSECDVPGASKGVWSWKQCSPVPSATGCPGREGSKGHRTLGTRVVGAPGASLCGVVREEADDNGLGRGREMSGHCIDCLGENGRRKLRWKLESLWGSRPGPFVGSERLGHLKGKKSWW